MGRIAFDRDQHEAALTHFRRALSLKPDLADAYNNMGNVLKELGQLEEAQAAFAASLDLDPQSTGAYVNFADGHRFAPGDPHLRAMADLASRPGALTRTDRMQLDFALAKAYADIKDHRRSFSHLRRGADAKRAQVAYDEAKIMETFARIEAVVSADLIRRKSGLGNPSDRPIFIVDMPRWARRWWNRSSPATHRSSAPASSRRSARSPVTRWVPAARWFTIPSSSRPSTAPRCDRWRADIWPRPAPMPETPGA